MTFRPPKPFRARPRVSGLSYLRAFRRDLLSALPERLFAAKMAEYRTPFFRSYLLNEPELVDLVLRARPGDFPKSDRVGEGLRPLLRNAVFLTNGPVWERQRRIIDPAFEGGRVRASLPAMQAAATAMRARLQPGLQDVEPLMSHVAADVIFRTLFSVPIEDALAARVFAAFQTYQRRQPILNIGALFRLPRWLPRGIGRQTRAAADEIRHAIAALVDARAAEIAAGAAPEDLASKIMTTIDPESGTGFDRDEVIDQIAIFFLAGHETTASALAWALFLLSRDPAAQARARQEAVENPGISGLNRMTFTSNLLRETLRLYPPVPMMVRETTRAEALRNRTAPRGAALILSPWHLHRNPRHWDDPDAFDPDRFAQPGAMRPICRSPPGPGSVPGRGLPWSRWR